MSRSRPDDRSGATGSGAAAIRGAVLIGAAVVLGIGLLASGFDQGGSVAGPSGPGGDDTTTSSPGDGTTTLATVAQPHQPSEVRVFVLNGSGLVGVAQQATDILNGRNFTTIPPDNYPPKVPATVVYFTEGYQADAEAVAALLNTAATAVAPMPNPPPVADTQLANVLVILGPDFQAA